MTDLRRQQDTIGAIASRAHDFAGWTQVCALLDELSDDDVRAHLGQLSRELAAWPAELRGAPPRWAARLRTEGREPRALLCRGLDLSMTTSRDELWRALDAPDAARISAVGVAHCGLDEAAAPELARRLARIGVARLWLTGNPIAAGIVPVLRLSAGGALTWLDAESCGLAGRALEAVAASGVAIGLRELGLAVNHLGARDLEHLARVPGIDGVRRLGLGGNKFLAAGVRALAEAPLDALRELDLEGTQCGDEGAAVLAAAPAFARLEKLSLMACSIGDRGAASLAAAPALAALRELKVTFNRITAAGASALLASAALPSLARLELDHNEIGDEIVDAIAGSPRVARLASLTLDDTYLGDEARARLLALPLPPGVLDLLLLRDD